jgi:hypothetical protein
MIPIFSLGALSCEVLGFGFVGLFPLNGLLGLAGVLGGGVAGWEGEGGGAGAGAGAAGCIEYACPPNGYAIMFPEGSLNDSGLSSTYEYLFNESGDVMEPELVSSEMNLEIAG